MKNNHILRKSLFVFGILLFGEILGSGTALATVAPAPQYLYFNANCADCALAANSDTYNVVARLELDQYVYGQPLTNGTFLENGNVISFSYSGSNLIAPFETLAQRVGEKTPPGGMQSISGLINTGLDWPEPTDGWLDMIFGGNGQRFTIALNGDWAYYSGSTLPNDYGHGIWSLTAGIVGPQTQQIPEPGSLLLFGLGAAGLALNHLSKRGQSKQSIGV